nr:TPA_inf: conotoxin precursor Ggeo01 [Conus ebraeus]
MSRLFLILLVISVITMCTNTSQDGNVGIDKRSGQLSRAIEDNANTGFSWKRLAITKFRRSRRSLSDHTIEEDESEEMNNFS